MEVLLRTESDLSTRRNALVLLFLANQEKAFSFIQHAVSEQFEEMGDLVQLVILDQLRRQSRTDVSLRSKLLKIIAIFSKSNSQSVQLECANTLVSVSSAQRTLFNPAALKMAAGIYIQLLQAQQDNNVRINILDKLLYLHAKTKVSLQNSLVELTQVLKCQSWEIRSKTLGNSRFPFLSQTCSRTSSTRPMCTRSSPSSSTRCGSSTAASSPTTSSTRTRS